MRILKLSLIFEFDEKLGKIFKVKSSIDHRMKLAKLIKTRSADEKIFSVQIKHVM